MDDDEYEYISSVEIAGGAGEIFSGEDSMAIRVWESDDFNFSIPVLGGYPIETFDVDAYEGYTYVRIGSMSDWPVENAVVEVTFAPNANVTSEQLLSILMRYADYKGVDVSAAAAMIAPYEYAEWAETAVVWAHINGMLGEKDDLTGDATRAEIAMRLYKMAVLLK